MTGVEIGRRLNLFDGVKELINTDPDRPTVLYARRPWSSSSEALMLLLDDEPPSGSDFQYFLESFVAQEVLEAALDSDLDDDKVFELILYYAENDAFPEWLAAD